MFPFRQAVYIDAGGMDPAKSVPAAVKAGQMTAYLRQEPAAVLHR